MQKTIFIIQGFLTVMLLSACKKFVDTPPPITEVVGSAVYSSNSTAASAVTGIYQTMLTNSVGGGFNGISVLAGLSADEFALYPGAAELQEETYTNAQLSTDPSSIWGDLYNLIYQANSAIAGISSSSGVTQSMKDQLIGEAQFVRAFCYFYLVNLYGDVPLALSSNYEENRILSRTSSVQVYQQIITDLKGAQAQLNQSYLSPGGAQTTERVRPNYYTATALLSRVYLYNHKYDSAESEASIVINSSQYSLVTDLDSAFLADNNEAIWQLEQQDNGFSTADAGAFLLSYWGGPHSYLSPIELSDSLELNFEPGDNRKIHWTDSVVEDGTLYYFPYKYKFYYTGSPATEYTTIFRLAEQFLIRAEARANQGNLTGSKGAIADLNTIRLRAGITPYLQTTDQDSVLMAIMNERRFELFSEYGHRWFDLKRTGNIDALMNVVAPQKGGIRNTQAQLYPIPETEILADPKLTQNPGYN